MKKRHNGYLLNGGLKQAGLFWLGLFYTLLGGKSEKFPI